MLQGICGPGNCTQACVNSRGEPTVSPFLQGSLAPGRVTVLAPLPASNSPPPGCPVYEMPGDQGNQWLLCPLQGRHFITLGGIF